MSTQHAAPRSSLSSCRELAESILPEFRHFVEELLERLQIISFGASIQRYLTALDLEERVDLKGGEVEIVRRSSSSAGAFRRRFFPPLLALNALARLGPRRPPVLGGEEVAQPNLRRSVVESEKDTE